VYEAAAKGAWQKLPANYKLTARRRFWSCWEHALSGRAVPGVALIVSIAGLARGAGAGANCLADTPERHQPESSKVKDARTTFKSPHIFDYACNQSECVRGGFALQLVRTITLYNQLTCE
jgi:hypothetical protein